MGKAMMGTGEASGDKRALRSAEAAIANPLIDSVSMRGARGLLISITGGRDLTLYEVDEAATRIREEADADANIIVGATFDESLDGIIRVSVVATGLDIDAANNIRPATSSHAPEPPQSHVPPAAMQAPRANLAAEANAADVHEARIAELAQQLKADNARVAERAEAYAPRSAAESKVFILPPAAQPATRPPGMPRIEDFPAPGQKDFRAKRGELQQDDHPEKRRLTLLQRLAAVGLGRGEDQLDKEQTPKVHAPEPAKRQLAERRRGQKAGD
jgi:cell division protein FtsZ